MNNTELAERICNALFDNDVPANYLNKRIVKDTLDSCLTPISPSPIEVINDIDRMAEDSWEGCDGCTETDKQFYISGFHHGYNRATPNRLTDEEIICSHNNFEHLQPLVKCLSCGKIFTIGDNSVDVFYKE